MVRSSRATVATSRFIWRSASCEPCRGSGQRCLRDLLWPLSDTEVHSASEQGEKIKPIARRGGSIGRECLSIRGHRVLRSGPTLPSSEPRRKCEGCVLSLSHRAGKKPREGKFACS